MPNSKKFISFNEGLKELEITPIKTDMKTKDNIKSSMFIITESTKLLEGIMAENSDNFFKVKETLQNIRKEIDKIIENFNTPLAYPDYIADIIREDLKQEEEKLLEKSRAKLSLKLSGRQIEGGGMAPPKIWDSKLKDSDKETLIKEMRQIREQGQVLVKSNFHNKLSLSIEEFTEPFKYLEDMRNYKGAYDGSFLTSLLKSEAEINNQAVVFQTDLSFYKEGCMNGEKIILSIHDIIFSSKDNEEKKFLIVLYFNKLNGTINFLYPIFAGGKKTTLSPRQLIELEKFCKIKKIIL